MLSLTLVNDAFVAAVDIEGGIGGSSPPWDSYHFTITIHYYTIKYW